MAKQGDSSNNRMGEDMNTRANAARTAGARWDFSLVDGEMPAPASYTEQAAGNYTRFDARSDELTTGEAIFVTAMMLLHPELREFAASRGLALRGLAAETTVVQGTRVYRVSGDGSPAGGPSWTTVDPRTVASCRNVAGLPNDNSGRFLSAGSLQNTQGVTLRAADPLHGNVGGLPEVRIPNPALQIRLENVQGLNPEF